MVDWSIANALLSSFTPSFIFKYQQTILIAISLQKLFQSICDHTLDIIAIIFFLHSSLQLCDVR